VTTAAKVYLKRDPDRDDAVFFDFDYRPNLAARLRGWFAEHRTDTGGFAGAYVVGSRSWIVRAEHWGDLQRWLESIDVEIVERTYERTQHGARHTDLIALLMVEPPH
jgi:hypothetical protein